jgi:hypothetical protein
MTTPSPNIDDCIMRALSEVKTLMCAAFEEVGGIPKPGSGLDQNGLLDGEDIIVEYLDAGEPGLALEHLLYMVREPHLPISPATYQLIEAAGRAVGIDTKL